MPIIGREPPEYKPKPYRPPPPYIPPPAAFDNNLDEQVALGLAAMTSGGYTITFTFSGNYGLEVPASGTLLLGSGTANAIPQLLNANTITDSNLRMTGANVLTLAASGAATATVPYTGTVQSGRVVALTPSAAITMDCSLSSTFTLVPSATGSITPSNATAGTIYNLIITTSGTTSYTITFAAPFKVTGTLATGTVSAKIFCISFVYDSALLVERSRTIAM